MVRVVERVRALGIVDEVVVATDAPEVGAVVQLAGGAGRGARVVMTSPHHESGTERVAEVARRPEFARYDLILNVQGDEPFLPADAARGAVARARCGHDIGTAAAPLEADLADDPARVKVVFDLRGRALYFSRARIPSPRDPAGPSDYWQHLGVYAYSRDALERWVGLAPAALERVERLEQLRPLAHGLDIGVATVGAAAPGIDTPEDLTRADANWESYATMGGWS